MSALVPLTFFGNEDEIEKAQTTFDTLASIKYFSYLQYTIPSRLLPGTWKAHWVAYTVLSVIGSDLAKEIENLLIDDPIEAEMMLSLCRIFIDEAIRDPLCAVRNFTTEQNRLAQSYNIPQSKEPRFPIEIGKFLMSKLTYAPKNLRACNDLIDHFASYDLQRLQQSLNEAIIHNQPNYAYETAKQLEEVLDNVWNDKTVPRTVKGLKVGLPLSIAAIGSIAAGPIGGLSGLLAGFGFDVLSRLVSSESEQLSERLAKIFVRNYQANVYDFKRNYKGRITSP